MVRILNVSSVEQIRRRRSARLKAQQGLTLVKFSITKLSDAQRAHLWCKEVVRELENYQHVSPEANVSRFSFICYSSETGMLYFNTTQFSAF